MSTQPPNKDILNTDFLEKSEEELQEEIKNQQTIDIYLDTEKNWL